MKTQLLARCRGVWLWGVVVLALAGLGAAARFYSGGRAALAASADAPMERAGRPHRDPPRLLSAQEAQAGLSVGLRQMRERHVAREVQEATEPRRMLPNWGPPPRDPPAPPGGPDEAGVIDPTR